MAKVDFKLGEDKEDVINNGDFAIGVSEQDDVDLLLRVFPGHIRHNPTFGLATILQKNGASLGLYKAAVLKQLKEDGINVNLIYKDINGNLIIDIS